MHHNNFFASNENDVNTFNQSRVSSLFSKKPQFCTLNTCETGKNRPASVSKIVPGSTQKDIMKLLPLIKMTKKIQSKLKALSMFFWCRLESLPRKKSLNFQENPSQQKSQKFLSENQLKISSKDPTTNDKSSNQVSDLPLEEVKPQKLQNSEKTSIPIVECQQDSGQQKQNVLNHKKEQFFETRNPNQWIFLQRALESMLQRILKQSHRQILICAQKRKSLQKFQKIKIKCDKKRELFDAVRLIKRYAQQVMKVQILGNTLKYCIKRKTQDNFDSFVKKLKDLKNNQINESSKRMRHAEIIDQQKDEKKLLSLHLLQTDEPTPRPITSSTGSSVNSIKSSTNQKFKDLKTEVAIRPNESKPIKLKLGVLVKGLGSKEALKQDKIIFKSFNHQPSNERMKKAVRLHPEEPFFQIPDISEITIFNASINFHSTVSQFASKKSLSSLHSQKSFSELNTQRLTPRNFASGFQIQAKSQQLSADIPLAQNPSDMSPEFKKQSFGKDSQKKLQSQKSQSLTKIIYLRKSSTDLKNYPHTPSTKKIAGLFSKKKSAELFDKNSIVKKPTPKLVSCKSSTLKRPANFSETKVEKDHESQTKNGEVNSRQKSENNQISAFPKSFKGKIEFQQIVVKEPKGEIFLSQSTKPPTNVLKKPYDLSAKRIGTIVKKDLKRTGKKLTQSASIVEKISDKKNFERDQGSKENKLSQFNVLSGKVISYQEFIKQCPKQLKNLTARKPLMEISENEPVFGQIQINQPEWVSTDEELLYQSCSAQLPRDQIDLTEGKSKRLRAKIEKMEMNTARKMKMEIENMINQRKKKSIGILKY